MALNSPTHAGLVFGFLGYLSNCREVSPPKVRFTHWCVRTHIGAGKGYASHHQSQCIRPRALLGCLTFEMLTVHRAVAFREFPPDDANLDLKLQCDIFPSDLSWPLGLSCVCLSLMIILTFLTCQFLPKRDAMHYILNHEFLRYVIVVTFA